MPIALEEFFLSELKTFATYEEASEAHEILARFQQAQGLLAHTLTKQQMRLLLDLRDVHDELIDRASARAFVRGVRFKSILSSLVLEL